MTDTTKDTAARTGTSSGAGRKQAKTTSKDAAAKTFPTRIAIPEAARNEIIELLNQTLADNETLHSHTKQAHWNVKGAGFYELHLLFDRIAGSIEDFTDTVAERITALGGTALGTTQDVAAATSFKPFPTDSHDGKAYLQALQERYAMYGGSLRDAAERCGELKDTTSEDLLINMTHPADEALYFLEALLN